MIARDYVREDAGALDRLLGLERSGDVRLDRDRLVVLGPVGSPFAALVWRPYALLHEFHCGSGLSRRLAASALASYAVGSALARPHEIRDSIFLVDVGNEPMHRLMRELHAVREDGIIYTYPLRHRL